jgi:hypothetical protein
MQDEHNEEDGSATADDAIPIDAIWLTDAYELALDLLNEHHELLPKFDKECSEVLEKSRKKS